jgi:hypothetical protein
MVYYFFTSCKIIFHLHYFEDTKMETFENKYKIYHFVNTYKTGIYKLIQNKYRSKKEIIQGLARFCY